MRSHYMKLTYIIKNTFFKCTKKSIFVKISRNYYFLDYNWIFLLPYSFMNKYIPIF